MKTITFKTAALSAAAALMAVSAALTPAQAAPAQNRPQAQQHDRNDHRTDHRNDSRDDRRDDRGGRNDEGRYGRWDNNWGARPPAPPRGFTRAADWHRHVRACQQRYRSYDARTDRYTVRRGQTAICRL